MSENRNMEFCPRCGALMQDGVCRSCGYAARMSGDQRIRQTGGIGQKKPKKSKKGLIIALCVTGAVILVVCFALAYFYFIKSVTSGVFGFVEEYNNFDSYYEYDDDYSSDIYIPDENDAFYSEITDSTRTDLNYQIFWTSHSVNPDDSENSCSYYAGYPVLESDQVSFEQANEKIRSAALFYEENYKDYPGGSSTVGYVTYMDEEKVSIVLDHSLYMEDGTLPEIIAQTFSARTGEMIPPEQMIEVDEELIMRLRSQNQAQNGSVEYIENSSDEELLEALRDPERGFFFYTPVGLEVGINYETKEYGSGWVSVTLKDQAL